MIKNEAGKPMSRYTFYIDGYQANWIFAPIRNRKDVISLLMKVLKLILVYEKPEDTDIVGEISIVLCKMSRIFFSSETKVFSINFPFFVKESEGGLIFYTREFPEIDNRLTSIIIELIESSNCLSLVEILEFAEPVSDASNLEQHIWVLLRDLMIHEDGYVRFDHDPARVKENHPLNHYDFFYSTATTFKLEANQKPNIDYFIDVLDTKTVCYKLG